MKWIISKLAGLTPAGVCLPHCSEPDSARECAVGHVICMPTRTGDLCHWPVFLRTVCYVGKSFACRELPNNSFLFPYCMVSIILGFPLQYHIHVDCLVSVKHALKLGFRFLCIVCVLYVLLLLIYPIVLHMNYCKCYVWICIYSWNLCWSWLFCQWVVDV
jgi:hypothetical protein